MLVKPFRLDEFVLPLRDIGVLHRLYRKFDAGGDRRVTVAKLFQKVAQPGRVRAQGGQAQYQDVRVRRDARQAGTHRRRPLDRERGVEGVLVEVFESGGLRARVCARQVVQLDGDWLARFRDDL